MEPASRPPRSDAFSSIGRIIEAARRVFAAGGPWTLERIAREAGVGIATLYRHFPNRESLAQAVYEKIFIEEIEPLFAELARSDAAQPTLLDVATRIAEVTDRERGLVTALTNPTETTSGLLRRSIEILEPILRRGQEAGTIRTDLEPGDIPNIIAMFTAAFGTLDLDPATRRRYLGLMLDALTPPHATPAALT